MIRRAVRALRRRARMWSQAGRVILCGSRVSDAELARALASHDAERCMSGLRPGVAIPAGEAQDVIFRAEAACRREFDLLGGPVRAAEGAVAWHTDPVTGRRWSKRFSALLRVQYDSDESDIKRVWELSRCYHFPRLGMAYVLTGDTKYPREWAAQVLNWDRENPPLVGPNWMVPMEAAIRIVNWIWAWRLMGDSPEYTSAVRSVFLKNLLSHGRFILRHLEGYGNHRYSNFVGLAFAGVLFPEFREAAAWREVGLRGFYDETVKQVRSDGCHFEGSIPYHRLVLEMAATTWLMLRSQGIEPPDAVCEAIVRMFDFTCAYVQPNGFAPQVGDADDGRLQNLTGLDMRDHGYLLSLASVLTGDARYWRDAPHAETAWLTALTTGLHRRVTESAGNSKNEQGNSPQRTQRTDGWGEEGNERTTALPQSPQRGQRTDQEGDNGNERNGGLHRRVTESAGNSKNEQGNSPQRAQRAHSTEEGGLADQEPGNAESDCPLNPSGPQRPLPLSAVNGSERLGDAAATSSVGHSSPDEVVAPGDGRSLCSPRLCGESRRAFPVSGFYVLKAERLHAFVCCRRADPRDHGAHSHNDHLSFTLAADGVEFLVDSGTYTYTGNPAERERFRGTSAHNTILLDGQEINPLPRRDPFRLTDCAACSVVEWRSETTRERLVAEHHGYARLGVAVRRTFEHLRGEGRLRVTDEITGSGAHRVEWRFHFAPEVGVRTQERSVVAERDGVRLLLIVDGDTDAVPVLEDAWYSPHYGARVRNRVAVVRTQGPLPVVTEYELRVEKSATEVSESTEKKLMLALREDDDMLWTP